MAVANDDSTVDPPTYAIVLIILLVVIGFAIYGAHRSTRLKPFRDAVQARLPGRVDRVLGRKVTQSIPITRYKERKSSVPIVSPELTRVSEAADRETQKPSRVTTGAFLFPKDRASRSKTVVPSCFHKSKGSYDGPPQTSCSICTQDFCNGVRIRNLPCGHIFHPACIDPWLIDHSITCPLCRVDLEAQLALKALHSPLKNKVLILKRKIAKWPCGLHEE